MEASDKLASRAGQASGTSQPAEFPRTSASLLAPGRPIPQLQALPEGAEGLFPKSLTQKSQDLGTGSLAEERKLSQEVRVPVAVILVGRAASYAEKTGQDGFVLAKKRFLIFLKDDVARLRSSMFFVYICLLRGAQYMKFFSKTTLLIFNNINKV